MSKTIGALLLSAGVVLPGIANAVPEAPQPGSPGWGQCVTALVAARKADGNQANGQNNVPPVAPQIQAAKESLVEFGSCTPPTTPTTPPPNS